MFPKPNFKKMFAVWLQYTLISLNVIAQQTNVVKPRVAGYALVNGVNMYYETYGEGRPIVLIHGAYQTIPLCWSGFIPRLMKERKVIAIELRGHGHTADGPAPFSYKLFASDVAELLNYLKIQKADIMGFSLGGITAMQLAIDHPTYVGKLVILSAPYKYTGWLPEMRTVLEALKPDFLDKTPYKTAHKNIYTDTSAFHVFTRKFIEFDTENFDLGNKNIQNIKSPVQFIMGDNDGVDLKHKAELYKLVGGDVFSDIQGFPKSQLVILPHTGHVGLVMQAEKLVPVILPFLNQSP